MRLAALTSGRDQASDDRMPVGSGFMGAGGVALSGRRGSSEVTAPLSEESPATGTMSDEFSGTTSEGGRRSSESQARPAALALGAVATAGWLLRRGQLWRGAGNRRLLAAALPGVRGLFVDGDATGQGLHRPARQQQSRLLAREVHGGRHDLWGRG